MVAMYNYQQWITDTRISGKSRSSRLKALDRQVQQLGPNNPPLAKIKSTLAAFNAWADAKRQSGLHGVAPGLEPSAKARDDRGGFSKLLAQLHLAYLMADPDEYLANYTLDEAGLGMSGVVGMNVYSDASSNHAGVISDLAVRKRLKITNAPVNGGIKQESIQVFNVRMIPRTEAFNSANIESAVLSNNTEFMTTGMLSGCCFVAYREADVVLVAHVQSRGGSNGLLLKADISANGRFDMRPLDQVHTFGLGDYGTDAGTGAGYAMVVGVRRKNRWEIYGQDLGLSHNGPPIKVVRII